MKTDLKLIIALFVILLSFNSFAQDDEFSDFNSKTEQAANDVFSGSDDEFSSNDEFSESSNEFSEESSEFAETQEETPKHKTNWNRFYWAINILFATLLAGIFVRFQATRKLRPLFY